MTVDESGRDRLPVHLLRLLSTSGLIGEEVAIAEEGFRDVFRDAIPVNSLGLQRSALAGEDVCKSQKRARIASGSRLPIHGLGLGGTIRLLQKAREQPLGIMVAFSDGLPVRRFSLTQLPPLLVQESKIHEAIDVAAPVRRAVCFGGLLWPVQVVGKNVSEIDIGVGHTLGRRGAIRLCRGLVLLLTSEKLAKVETGCPAAFRSHPEGTLRFPGAPRLRKPYSKRVQRGRVTPSEVDSVFFSAIVLGAQLVRV